MALLDRLIEITELKGYWTLQAQTMIENKASKALCEKAGFRVVGYRERYGHIDGIWHDVTLLERRSKFAGGKGLPTISCS